MLTPRKKQIPNIHSIHELHIWRLDQKKAIASAHVVVSEDTSLAAFMQKAQTVAECLHAYGIHSATLQPELVVPPQSVASAREEQGVGKGGEGGQQVVAVGAAEEGGVVVGGGSSTAAAAAAAGLRQRTAVQGAGLAGCRLACGNVCEPLMCCN